MPFVDTGKSSNVPAVKPASVRQALPAVAVASFSALGGLLYGYDTGTISGIVTMEAFRRQYGQYYPINMPSNTDAILKPGYDISTSQTSLTVSILSIGTFLGSLCGAPLGDILGRRWGLQVAIVVFILGVVLQIAASALPLFDAGRIVAGLGVGIISTIVPMYQSETAPRWIRGAVVSGYQWFITIGLLVAAVANNGTKNRSNSAAYRIPIAIQIAFALFLSAGIFFLPESPRWLMKRNRQEEAATSLAKLYSTDKDDPIVRAELADVKTNLELELELGTGSYLDCFKKERNNFLRTITGMQLQAWQQLSGINFIFYYGTTFFKSAVPSGNPFVFIIISNVVNVLTTLPGMWMMERVGRRKLLIFGALWMTVCELIVGVVGTAAPTSNTHAGKALVAFVCVYIAGFASTWGPAAWVVCGEIFPLAIRAKALSLCVASNWALNWAIAYSTPHLVNDGKGNAGLHTKVFFIWTATCACGAMFAYLFIFETSGLSLEEVDELYVNGSALISSRVNEEIKSRRNELQFSKGSFHDKSEEENSADAAKKEVILSTA